MARSVSITRKQPRPTRRDEQRPVLQLPLVRPEWREPEAQAEENKQPERGVAVVDFYI